MTSKINKRLLCLSLATALVLPLGGAFAAENKSEEISNISNTKNVSEVSGEGNVKKVIITKNTTDTAKGAADKTEDKEVTKEEPEVKKIPATNIPVKPVVKPPVRLVKPEVQRGVEISRIRADIDGDGKEEIVQLMGNKVADSSHYKGDLYLIAKEPGSDKVKAFARPKNMGGYDAYLSTCDVTGDGACNIIIAAPTGGSGGIVDYRIIDFSGDNPREIFGERQNKGVGVTGNYEPDFKVKLVVPSLNKEFTMDLPEDTETYVRLNAYEENGDIKTSGLRPYSQDLVNLIAIDTNGDGRDEVITTQRVVGVTNRNALGHIRAKWEYKAGSWQQDKVEFQTTLEVKQDFSNEEPMLGKGGYEIVREEVQVDGNKLQYPHFNKLSKNSQWIVNKQLENYAKTVLHEVMGKGVANVKYDVTYAGKNYASIYFYGSVNKENKLDTVAEAFNFDLATGEDLPLKKAVGSLGKFWNMVQNKSKKENLVVNKSNVYNYYYDGDALILLYGDGKEFELKADEVDEYLLKGKIKGEISTKQSKAVIETKQEKKEENKAKTK